MAEPSQMYEWRNVQIVGGGFVPGIIFSHAEASLVYARTDIGGAYRMDNTTGGKWVPMLDWLGDSNWNYTGVLSLAADPTDANIVYCAVGTYINDWEPSNGAILKSTNRGATWTTTVLPFKVGGNMPGRGCGERLAIDPNNTNILYLGAEAGNGLWKSVDAGATWTKVTNFPNAGDFIQAPGDAYAGFSQGIYWVTFDKDTGTPGNATQTIYVGVADLSDTLYRTTNGGNTWERVAGQPTGYMAHKGKLDTVNNFLYIATSDKGGPYDGGKGEVWKYNTATGAWTQISPIPANSGDNFFGYSGLTIDQQNPATIMVTGYSSWYPDTMIWRSNNGGATWTRIWDWNGYPNRSFRYTMDISKSPWLDWGGGAVAPEVRPKLGWMTESLEIDPFNRNRMMYGTGATLFGTNNLLQWDSGGQISISVMCEGLEETAIQELVSLPSGPQLISGMYDVYGFTHSNVDVVPGKFLQNPAIATVTIDYAELSPSLVFRGGKGNSAGGIVSAGYSTDGGLNWTPVGSEPNGTNNGGTIAVSANGARVVWSPAGAGVHYSINNGANWTATTGLPSGTQVRSDRVNPNKFYGFSGETFYVSTNGGSSFTVAFNGLHSSAQFKVVPGQEGHIWLAAGSSGLWRSTDSGATFTQVTNVTEADVIGFGKAAPGQSYSAIFASALIDGVRGVFRSDDVGASWIRVNDDQHQYGWIGKTITGDPRIYGRVYIGTNGRGIVYGDIPAATPPTAPSTLAATAVSTNRIDLTWTDNASNETGFSIDRATDAAFSAGLVTTSVGANATTFQSTDLNASTTYHYRVRAVNSAGPSSNSNTANATTLAVPVATTTHIAAISVVTVGAGQGKKRGQATVTVRNNLGAVVPNAVVTGSFTGSINETLSATTNASGVATLTTAATAKGTLNITFCVSGVTHSTLSYNSAANVESCDRN